MQRRHTGRNLQQHEPRRRAHAVAQRLIQRPALQEELQRGDEHERQEIERSGQRADSMDADVLGCFEEGGQGAVDVADEFDADALGGEGGGVVGHAGGAGEVAEDDDGDAVGVAEFLVGFAVFVEARVALLE